MPESEPAWTRSRPAAYDIVTCWFPEAGKPAQDPKLRPCLVTAVLRDEESGRFACRLVYGTTSLKIVHRQHLDLIIQNTVDLDQVGLARATRFDLDNTAVLPWASEFFGRWAGYATPRIGALTETYIRDYAFLMMKRRSVKPR